MAGLRDRPSARSRRVLRLPPHQRGAAVPDRQDAEAGAPAGRLCRGRGDRRDHETRARACPRSHRPRAEAEARERLSLSATRRRCCRRRPW